MSRWWRSLLVVTFIGAVAGGCGGENPYEAAANATTTTTTVAAPVATDDTLATSDGAATGNSLATNEFLPEGQNLSDCVGAVEKPNCGSSAKGGWRQYTVMGVLMLGLGFVGWRISKGVRARDAIMNPPAG